jgi:hypothetical protein
MGKVEFAPLLFQWKTFSFDCTLPAAKVLILHGEKQEKDLGKAPVSAYSM